MKLVFKYEKKIMINCALNSFFKVELVSNVACILQIVRSFKHMLL